MNYKPVVIVGAGPAGLTAAYELTKRGVKPLLLEKSAHIGGLARTEIYKGYRFDIGGHRFFTKVGEVERLWHEMLGEDFISVPRLSRIYYAGKFFQYPLEIFNALANLGFLESFLILLSYCVSRIRPYPREETFEEWVSNRFGRRLYRTFFKTYTEKVWGIPCNQIRADWAAQRIKGMSLMSAVKNAIFAGRGRQPKSLIKKFHYPILGPGMMWERFKEVIESQGGEIRFNSRVVRINREGRLIKSIISRNPEGMSEVSAEHYISSMPVTQLIARLDPPPPTDVLTAARELSYRDFILVGLIINRKNLFPDNWIYIHSPEVKVGRIQNFKNWSMGMVPDPDKTSLGLEYFCNQDDETWMKPDSELIAFATRELAFLGLAKEDEVMDGVVVRQPKAYPVYDSQYRKCLRIIQAFLGTLDNLQTIGRNGMFRYNNQDHSMLTSMLAVRNLFGEDHDLWNVNTDRSYYEEFSAGPGNALR
jgi:protoporphyrinogen oxidase